MVDSIANSGHDILTPSYRSYKPLQAKGTSYSFRIRLYVSYKVRSAFYLKGIRPLWPKIRGKSLGVQRLQGACLVIELESDESQVPFRVSRATGVVSPSNKKRNVPYRIHKTLS